jgi:hypothetical protein
VGIDLDRPRAPTRSLAHSRTLAHSRSLSHSHTLTLRATRLARSPGELWDYLRTELEIESRFETLDMKLNLVQNNLKYILELHQNRKSVALEWTIIVLIAVEIVLSLVQISIGAAAP